MKPRGVACAAQECPMSDVAAQTLDAALDEPRTAPKPAKLSGAERKARARTAMLEGPIVSTW